jgi:hypothetical protein
MGTRYRNRWDDPPLVKSYRPSDFDICKLFTRGTRIRQPWGYRFLPGSYAAVLLRRGARVKRRVNALRGSPHYIELVDQPRNNNCEFVFRIGEGGVKDLKKIGFQQQLTAKTVPHDLLACMIAASFEVAAHECNIPISVIQQPELNICPDWLIFDFAGKTVFIEADMGTETNEPGEKRPSDIDKSKTPTSIWDKFERYLAILADRKFTDPFFLFVTCLPGRTRRWVTALRNVIDHHQYPYDYANHFGFKAVHFNRFMEYFPPATSWVGTEEILRATPQSFRFIGGISNG